MAVFGAIDVAVEAPRADERARTLLKDRACALWNGRYSPDGRCLCFNASGPPVSYIGIAPASGEAARSGVCRRTSTSGPLASARDA